jgi:uncharacterized protein (DUF362 family)
MVSRLERQSDANVVIAESAARSPREPFCDLLCRNPDLIPNQLPKLAIIKPNLCDNATWETGVTTDPAWVVVLAAELRRRRPDIAIQVVESDAISAYRTFRSCEESFDRLGYREAANEAKVQLVNLSESESWEVDVPTFPKPLRIPALFFENFYFISVANIKLHPYERFTGVMKNNYGMLPQQNRTDLHVWLPQVLFTLYQLCRTDLGILDGRIGLEGHGPIIGRPKRLNRIVVGNDALAVDQVGCRLIGIDPRTVPHLRYAAKKTSVNQNSVCVSGDTAPVPFVMDDPDKNALIMRKFAVRRFHDRLEKLSLRMTGWYFQGRKSPVGFFQRFLRRFLPR